MRGDLWWGGEAKLICNVIVRRVLAGGGQIGIKVGSSVGYWRVGRVTAGGWEGEGRGGGGGEVGVLWMGVK